MIKVSSNGNGMMNFAQAQSSPPTYQDVASIFQERCIICHNGPAAPKKLQLISYELMMKGSENGPVVIPGQPENSELIKRLKGISQPRMPLTGPPWLSDQQIALIEKWILNGAKKSLPTSGEGSTPEVSKPPLPPTADELLKKEVITFTDVDPILKMRCMKCHNTRGIMGDPPEGFIVNSYENLMSRSDRVRVVPGNPLASELVRRIKGLAHPRMPFDGPPYLSDSEIRLIEKWVQQGARDSSGTPAPLPVNARIRLHGTLSGKWILDGLPLKVNSSTRLKKSPQPGDYVRVRGIVLPDGSIQAVRIRRR